MPERKRPPCIYVFAGTNGAGKSSIAGAVAAERGVEYFNPDDVAQRISATDPSLSQAECNSIAWNTGRRLLQRAIAERLTFAFETTLGGNTIPKLLAQAISRGIEVRIWYVGLDSPELHIQRVRARVSRGGHDVPQSVIRERFHKSRINLLRLIPNLTELFVYDNSKEADPYRGEIPEVMLVVHMKTGKVMAACEPRQTPNWAKPIVMAALKNVR